MRARIKMMGKNWYYISDTYQASHVNLYTLLMAAKAHGEDITMYGDSELSLIVFNDEALYLMRHSADLFNVLRANYYFTEDQANELLLDLTEDLVELSVDI